MDVKHKPSSAHPPHFNNAELGVKRTKRMLRENMSTTGSLDTDNFKRALITHHNTPDRNTGLSPGSSSQINPTYSNPERSGSSPVT